MTNKRTRDARRQFDAFVRDSTSGLVRTAYLLTFDLAEAEDLAQETFTRVAARWDSIRHMEHPRAYARRVLVHLVYDGASRRARWRAELSAATHDDARGFEPADRSASAPFARIDDMTVLQRALAALPEVQRAVLVLRYFEDLTEAQIADLLGCSPGTVKKATWRAMARLRDTIEAHSTGCADHAPATR
ncbi:MAG TPA: SigE family RNA polymerase sigma factor [Acidimicrobiia bacterium]